MTTTSPIRVGLIGLSSNSVSSWAESAHLPYLISSPRYTIVALSNSSSDSAKSAVAHYKLPPTTRTYGSPTDLAGDPEVDLIVISVAVGYHYQLAKPVLQAGKDVYVEWPLAANVKQAKELAELAKEKCVRVIVGAQTRASPAVVKLRELLRDTSTIGKITSSSVVASLGAPAKLWPTSGAYALDLRSGGNTLTIRFGHFIDVFCHLLGDFSSSHSVLKTTQAEVKLVDGPLKEVFGNPPSAAEQAKLKSVHKTGPDEILLHGKLSSGAVASVIFRSAAQTFDNEGLRWIITGTDGEIEIRETFSVGYLHGANTKVRVMRKGGKVEEVKLDWEQEGKWKMYGQNTFGANVGRLYEAFANGDNGLYLDFEEAVKRHELFDGMIEEAERVDAQ